MYSFRHRQRSFYNALPGISQYMFTGRRRAAADAAKTTYYHSAIGTHRLQPRPLKNILYPFYRHYKPVYRARNSRTPCRLAVAMSIVLSILLATNRQVPLAFTSEEIPKAGKHWNQPLLRIRTQESCHTHALRDFASIATARSQLPFLEDRAKKQCRENAIVTRRPKGTGDFTKSQ